MKTTVPRPPRSKGPAGFLRRPKYSAHAFILTIILISAITAFSLIANRAGYGAGNSGSPVLRSRDLSTLKEKQQNLECRLVHEAHDKCAFVQANCPDEEAGLFSYLTLYYCKMPNAKPVAFTIMVLWLGLLFSTIGIAASDFFCVNLSTISSLLGMSESLAGVTFLAFGNGSPDVFSTFAAMSTGSGSLAVGELIGAAGFITAVVAGSMAIVRPFKVTRKSFVRDVGFFIVAAGFSLVFLYDGVLYLWECLTMVAIYAFYVIFVILWHWWMDRQRRKKTREAVMRAHYVTPGGEEADVEPYHDDEEGESSRHSTRSRGLSIDDFSALERGGDPLKDGVDDDEEEMLRERLMGELSNSMRLSRPRLGHRRTTQGQIRPSLVGALEFRAVLTSLKKSRNIHGMPLDMRRYTDNPELSAQHPDAMSTVSDPAMRPYTIAVEDGERLGVGSAFVTRRGSGNRIRAVSVNDADGMNAMHPSSFRNDPAPIADLLGPISDEQRNSSAIVSEESLARPPQPTGRMPPSPDLAVTPPAPEQASPSLRVSAAQARPATPDRLAPPGLSLAGMVPSGPSSHTPETQGSPVGKPLPAPHGRAYPKLDIPNQGRRPGSSPSSPFPAFDPTQSPRPPTLLLPSPSASPDSYFPRMNLLDPTAEERPVRQWPYSFLPPPGVLFSTLFPTLYSWRGKKIWEKFLGIIAAPSVFLLTITLPVVESEKGEPDNIPTLSLNTPTSTLAPSARKSRANTSLSVNERYRDNPSIIQTPAPDSAGHVNMPPSVILGDDAHQRPQRTQTILNSPNAGQVMLSPDQMPAMDFEDAGSKGWNRWLVIVQCFTAPFFIVLVVWANTSSDDPRALLRPALISLVVSLVLLLVILLGTTPERAPRWRSLLCFVGFVVAISWISTIANEVVGVLKTLGVVLDISDAILGLTIFAVGNSLGDLVADITVARLGFPVMALSACFGGPMMNILLGIGVSGSYITIKNAEKHHHKHPGPIREFKPYRIHVSPTLLVSGAALMVTLAWLIVIVPLRRWRMDKFIGWSLVALWVASTVGNVVMEVVGFGES